ncbi:MAG: Sll0314/Alr1548 family TPR repeat-containing protein [Cyanobacteria bacterium P01_H01_bin.15]
MSVPLSPAIAGDPFRTQNTRDIDDTTEAAFNAFFQEGDYPLTEEYLAEAMAEPEHDPIVPAMWASVGYLQNDDEQMAAGAQQTLEQAAAIVEADPLRGNLYLAVGHFLAGAYEFEQDKNVLQAISTLQTVLTHLDLAVAADAKDPELNLIKGYLDLLLALNLPYSSPEKAISQFETYAGPDFLVQRGIAIAYRDLEEFEPAFKYAETARKATPENPEVWYLKAQILREQGLSSEDPRKKAQYFEQAEVLFADAVDKSEQLPRSVRKPLEREYRNLQKDIAALDMAETEPKSPSLPNLELNPL